MINLSGHELNEAQVALVECYRRLEDVLSRQADDLAPYERRNALKALAALWQVVNGLDLDPDPLYGLGG